MMAVRYFGAHGEIKPVKIKRGTAHFEGKTPASFSDELQIERTAMLRGHTVIDIIFSPLGGSYYCCKR
jgi:hypothetical protein